MKRGRPGKLYKKGKKADFKVGTQARAVYDAVLAGGRKGVTSASICETVKDQVQTKGNLAKHVAFHLCAMKKEGVVVATAQ